MILILLGPPGSGKGTQAKILSADRHWPQLSTGDMFREAISKGTQLGREAKQFMDQGTLVPDSVVIGLIEDRVARPDCEAGFILDGFPRNVAQAVELDEMLSKRGKKVERAVLFEIPDADLVSRLSGRRTCEKCGAMFHLIHAKPLLGGQCDACSGSLVQRSDDQPEVIQNRLKVYHQQTEPLVGFYREQDKLRSLNAKQGADEVTRALVQALA